MRKALTQANRDIYQVVFYVLIGLMTIVLPVLSIGAGINGDEKYQVFISNHILDFYTSFGKNRNVLLSKEETDAIVQKEGKEKLKEMGLVAPPYVQGLRYYGAGFEFFSALLGQMFGYKTDEYLGFHDIRHVLLGMIGVFILLFTGLLAKDLFGWRAGVIALILLFVSPRFIGHTIMNPKDIPFTLGYIMSLYFLIRFLKEIPSPSIKSMAGLIGGIAIAINIRIGGVLLIIYLIMFCMLFWIYLKYYQKEKRLNNPQSLKEFFGKTAIVAGLGYFLGLVFWPFGLINPIKNPYDTLVLFSNYPANIRQLFEGVQIFSVDLPWYYLPKYLLISNPIVALLGALLFCVFLYYIIKKENVKWTLLSVVLFMAIFPVIYIIYKQSVVYSGWRHILFVYPPLVVLAAIGWEALIRMVKPQAGKIAVGVVIGAMCLVPLSWMLANHPYQYIYFNELVGGSKKAYKDYVTDYWQISIKEASEWIVKNTDPNKKIIVGTNCHYPASIYLNSLADHIEVKYVRYYERNQKPWDYGLFYIDYVIPHQLKNNLYPPDKTVHTIESGGVPLCAIIDRSDKNDFLGYQALESGNYEKALGHFEAAIKSYPRTEAVATGLGMAYMNLSRFGEARKAFEQSVKINPTSAQVYYYLGASCAQTSAMNEAILYLQQAIKLAPGFRGAYQLLGNIYQQQGDTNTAKRYFDAANRM